MPKDTDDHPAPRKNSRNINNLYDLTRYVQTKTAKEDDDIVANFSEVEKACRFLLSKIIAREEDDPNSIPKNAFANFLDVLSHAESFRLRIIEQAELALNTWHVYYAREDPTQALSLEEAAKLETILKSKVEWRTVYMKIMKKTITLDMYYLFISKPWFASDFMVRLLEYNPHMFQATEELKPHPRNCILLLSEDELKQIKEMSKKSLQFIKDSYEWLEENFSNDIMMGLYSEEFQKTHPPPTDLQRLQNLLRYYLKHISDIYLTVTTIFPPQPSQNSAS
ncbi:hypothetical protein D9756_007523 [Leucocoprinus leucothites]|uniref:Uncharacterized protein n=1 Tax=Leucocoprinus leucothites TaxID=201217 RepID=A0A8H5FVX0_9AGAR|nr:hypothetical protein D9756_007523 [Leucoagaricus leucothites]